MNTIKTLWSLVPYLYYIRGIQKGHFNGWSADRQQKRVWSPGTLISLLLRKWKQCWQRKGAGTRGYSVKMTDKVRALHKGQGVSTLVRVCVHNVLIFHTEGTFCWLPKLSAPLPRAAKRTDSRDHFSAGSALASFSLPLQNDLNRQLSSTSFQQSQLFWKLVNNAPCASMSFLYEAIN